MDAELNLLEWQRDQYAHDMRNHFDILSLHKQERIRHYAGHFAKYVGRVARGKDEKKPVSQTLIDGILVCLSAANTLHQHLSYTPKRSNVDFFYRFADAAGRFNDASEKIDHLEPFVDAARTSNQDIFDCLVDEAFEVKIELPAALDSRRAELRARQFFIR